MKKLIAFGMVFGLMVGAAQAATINAQVVTDKLVYNIGDTVQWTIYAWTTSADGTSGVALLALNLVDDTGDPLQKADQELVGGLFPQLAGTTYGLLEGFDKQTYGTLDPSDGAVRDIIAADTDPTTFTPDVGIADSPPLPVFAEGEYVVTTLGDHTLSVSYNGANYWASDTATQASEFEDRAAEHAHFSVVPEPATLLLAGMGFGLMGLIRRRRS